MVTEQLLTMVVGNMIPKSCGISLPVVSIPNDQIYSSLCDICGARDVGDRLTGVRPQRSTSSPLRCADLLEAGLAGHRYGVFAKQRFGSKDCGSASRYRPSLSDTPDE